MSSAESVRDLLIWLNHQEFRRANANAKAVADGAEREHPLYIERDAVRAAYANLRLGTLFQPIVRGARVIGHEALLTMATPGGADRIAVFHGDLTAHLDAAQDIVYFDRLARTLHTLNFLPQNIDGDLHLNVDAHHLLAVTANHGQAFEQIIRQCGLDPSRIVLELPEHAINDKDRLRGAIAAWQSRRYRIAIDHFGHQHAQLGRVLELRPDAIKIDREFWQRHQSQSAKQKLRDLVERIVERGIAVMFTGIDSAVDQRALAQLPIAAQGNFFGEPDARCLSNAAPAIAASA